MDISKHFSGAWWVDAVFVNQKYKSYSINPTHNKCQSVTSYPQASPIVRSCFLGRGGGGGGGGGGSMILTTSIGSILT